jgi:hypothetical protein
MIDGALKGMIDETLPRSFDLSGPQKIRTVRRDSTT